VIFQERGVVWTSGIVARGTLGKTGLFWDGICSGGGRRTLLAGGVVIMKSRLLRLGTGTEGRGKFGGVVKRV